MNHMTQMCSSLAAKPNINSGESTLSRPWVYTGCAEADTRHTSCNREVPVSVLIKSFDVKMDVKNKGVEFEVRDNLKVFLGDCIVTRRGLVWCKGKLLRRTA